MAPSSRSIAGSGGSLSQALVVAEVALAVILVAGAGLMLRTPNSRVAMTSFAKGPDAAVR